MSVPFEVAPVTLAMRPAAIAALSLSPGQTLSARVVGPAANGTTLVQAGAHQLTINLPLPVAAGAVLHLRAEGKGAEMRLVLLGGTPAAPAASAAAPPVIGHPPAQSRLPANASGSSTPAPGPPAEAADPARLALARAAQSALGRQAGIGALLGALAAAGPALALMPGPVRRAAEALLAGGLDLDGPGGLSGPALRAAAFRSGVFQEALLAQAGNPAARILLKGEVKGRLLALARALGVWLGAEEGAVEPVPAPLPPRRGDHPRAPRLDPPPPLPAPPAAAGEVLRARTEAALSRLRLLQLASLPEDAPRARAPAAEWSLELPVILAGAPGALALHIHRDPPGEDGAEGSERGYKLRFALDHPELGETGAQVGLRGRRVSVLVWAADPGTAALIARELPALPAALAALGLEPGTVLSRAGAPEQPAHRPGEILDARS